MGACLAKCNNNAIVEKQQVRLTEKRSCTDIFFVLLYIFAWAVFIYSSVEARQPQANGLPRGNPAKLTNGIDWEGQICGFDEKVKDKPLGAWPYLGEPSVMICVDDCAFTSEPFNDYMIYAYSSTDYLGYCVPFPNGTVSVSINVSASGDFASWWNGAGKDTVRAIGDVRNSVYLIFASMGASVVLGFVFVYLLKFIATMVVFVCVLVITFMGAFIGYIMLTYSQTVADQDFMADTQKEFFHWGAYVVWAISVIFALVMFALRKEILIAVEVVREASRALRDMKALIVVPIVPLLVLFGYLVLWISQGLWVFSVSDLVQEPMPEALLYKGAFFGFGPQIRTPFPDNRYVFRFDDSFLQTFGAIHLFHGLWTVQFIMYMSYATIAASLAMWYFTPRDKHGDKLLDGEEGLGRFPIFSSFWRTFRFHSGTIALAALIIAIIQMARAVVRYVEHKLKQGGNPSVYATAILKIIRCCLYCAECCMDKINKNAIIWMAIYGNNFCISTCSSFALVWRNLFRLAAVNTVTILLLTLGKVAVAMSCTAVSVVALAYAPPYNETIYSPVFPGLIVFILSYCVARSFFQVFESIIDATFFCFLVDAENNEKGKMLAHKKLQKLVGKYSKESEEEARVMQMSVDDIEESRSSRMSMSESGVTSQIDKKKKRKHHHHKKDRTDKAKDTEMTTTKTKNRNPAKEEASPKAKPKRHEEKKEEPAKKERRASKQVGQEKHEKKGERRASKMQGERRASKHQGERRQSKHHGGEKKRSKKYSDGDLDG